VGNVHVLSVRPLKGRASPVPGGFSGG